MTDLNDVKAGKYQLVSSRWDQITSKPGEPLDYVRHRRGDIVELNSEDAKRLVAAGAVVKPGQLEKSKAEQAKDLAERARLEYEAILAGLPEDVRAEIAPETVARQAAPSTPSTPTKSSSKADWVAYATDEARGDQVMTAEDAEKATRDELAAKYLGDQGGAS